MKKCELESAVEIKTAKLMTDSEKIKIYLQKAAERRKQNSESGVSPGFSSLEIPVKDINL